MPTTFGTSTVGSYIYSIYATYGTGSGTVTSYTLTTSATNGTVTKTPNQTTYTSGQTVSLKATPNTGYTFTGWSGALTGTTNPATLVMNSNKSVTANFAATSTGNTKKKVGNATAFTGVATALNRRAVPYTMSEAGELESISIYHNGGSGQMLMGVYSDSSSRPGTRLGVTNAVTVNASAGWQTVSLQSAVSVAAGQKLWLAWVLQNSVGIRAAAGTPGRAEAGTTWSGGMPTTFGTSTVGSYIYSIYATYRTGSVSTAVATETVGNTTVFDGVATAMNRRAVPYTMSEAGQLQSISICHDGGSGQILMGVYGDKSSRPGTRLGVTNAVTVNASAGWQTVSLQSPVAVTAGQKVWLAWVLQSSVGVRATAGSPGRTEANATWSGGMPTTFGNATVGNYIYSIYATYLPADGAVAIDATGSVPAPPDSLSDNVVEASASTTGLTAAGPVRTWTLNLGEGVCVDQTGRNHGHPATVADAQGNTWVVWHAGNTGERQVYATSFFPVPGYPASLYS
jgi:uncharacterized repeat protein (TIGR02543 family)